MPLNGSSIIDNRGDNTLLYGLREMSEGGKELWIAAAFFSLDGLLLLADTLEEYDRIRILFGDDASAVQRKKLLELLSLRSDADLLAQREALPHLSPLKKVEALFMAGRIEARCYTKEKFHAKAYLIHRPIYPSQLGVIGSGNFTRPGLLQNIELNVVLTTEQTANLEAWFEERWEEAAADVVTEDLLKEIRRQIDLYEPYILYLKALTTWGQQQQEDGSLQERSSLLDLLDPHQLQGVLRALKIIELQHGVMICDGVGLGKSFIALALMEHFCREGQNVLLLAPKSILSSSWDGYLDTYLSRFRSPFESIHEMAMTELGFPPEDEDEDEADLSQKTREHREKAKRLYEQCDVIVVDESHNFRTTSASRYQNLFHIVAPYRGKRKIVILLTATPINTVYRDISAQLALITSEQGRIGGYSIEQIRRFSKELDKEDGSSHCTNGQLTFQLMETPSESLNRVLESAVIQRSRATCKALSDAVGKKLLFPKREKPECIEYTIDEESERYRELINLSEARFRPGVTYLEQVRDALAKLVKTDIRKLPAKLKRGAPAGITLAAFLAEQYRREPTSGRRYHDEVYLAGLVFTNALKQLESSPAAFQGILQSLGEGLIARLHHVLGDAATPLITPHRQWVQTPLFRSMPVESDEEEVDPDIELDGDALDASGAETDDWLAKAVSQRQLSKKLRDFNNEVFDVDRWKNDIVSDLHFLQEIHTATLRARQQPDPKLDTVLPKIRAELAQKRRVLVFTQSQRTAQYLENTLKERLKGYGVARIDSRVGSTRAAILHAFCPNYNPPATAPSVPKKLEVLISTDVLSEGVNLQETGAIFNYDIHWNPVRLIQRIGRVDRRLNPAATSADHSFNIYNVLPPEEIDDILQLIGTVEQRTYNISRTLGLDVSFFKSTDPAGTLKEFNAQYEGEITPVERALTQFAAMQAKPNPELQRKLDALPPGAFGVWRNAPCDSLFALFTMEAKLTAPASDRERFAAVLGRPMLVLEQANGAPLLDAGKILALLSGIVPGEPSALPSDEAQLAQRLRRLKQAVRQQFSIIGLPATIIPRLVCWLELRKGKQ